MAVVLFPWGAVASAPHVRPRLKRGAVDWTRVRRKHRTEDPSVGLPSNHPHSGEPFVRAVGWPWAEGPKEADPDQKHENPCAASSRAPEEREKEND